MESKELARLIHGELRACGVRHMVGVPDVETNALWQCFVEDPEAKVITTGREGEAMGICGGLHLAGHKPLFCVKNFGLFESLDTLRMIGVDLGTPLLMFVGYAGRPVPGVEDKLKSWLGSQAAQLLLAGQWTEKVLQAIEVPYYVIDKPEDLGHVRRAAEQAYAGMRPVALLGQLP